LTPEKDISAPARMGARFVLLIILLAAAASWCGSALAENPDETPAQTALQPELVDINLDDVEVVELIRYLGQYTEKNFVVGPEVRGRVTVVASKKIRREDSYAVLESVLWTAGYGMVPVCDDRLLRVVPRSDALVNSPVVVDTDDVDMGDADEGG
jgi:type II secretory pathway component GspD/PulD (secretin)